MKYLTIRYYKECNNWDCSSQRSFRIALVRKQNRLKSSQDLTVGGKSTDALSWNVFDSSGLTRVIDPDHRNVLVCETVSGRKNCGQSLLCNALRAAFSKCHSLRCLIGSQPNLRISILVNVSPNDKTCRGNLNTLKSFKKLFSNWMKYNITKIQSR